MSASPAQAPSGPNSVTPNEGMGTPIKRKKAPVSIFNPKKKPMKKVVPPPKTAAPMQETPQQSVNTTHGAADTPAQTVPEESYDEFPIFISRNHVTRGLRYHVMKLHSKPDQSGSLININPYDEAQFVRPVHLHRRFAHDKMETTEQSEAASGVDDKEREHMNARRAERQAEREENQRLIAPTGGDASKPTKKKLQKKVEEGRNENDPVRKKRQQLRYEEARPWHLEDFDRKNVWVGSYEEPLSEQSVIFMVEPGGFQMIPIEKWYKFIATNKVKTMDSEEIEKHFNKKATAGRWALGTQLANEVAVQEQRRRIVEERRARIKEEGDDNARNADDGEYRADRDEPNDWGDDEFQDDDGDMLLAEDDDDEIKEAQEKIKMEMREANLAGTGVKDEDKDWDEEERKEQLAEQEEKKKQKRMKKQLLKKERRNEYFSDSNSNPYSESSESEDSDEERTRLEEEQKKEEARKLLQINGDKSGASSRGNNTPTGRLEKRDPSRSGATLGKRPGSPDVSDLSGNESSRKKAKNMSGRAVSTSATGGARSLSRKLNGIPAIDRL